LGVLGVLSEFCHLSSQNIDISLIVVRSPPSHGTIIGDWRAIVQSLASCPNGQSSIAVYNTDAIAGIENAIGSEHPHFTRFKIVKMFKLKVPQQVVAESITSNANMHCETALAVLKSKFHEKSPPNGTLANLMEVCSLICVDVCQAYCVYRIQTWL